MALTPMSDGDDEDTNAMYKAAYLYSFTKLVDWPQNYKRGDFVIGVITKDRSSNLYKELEEKYANKRVGSQSIKVKRFSSASEVSGKCHILFLNEDLSSQVSRLRNTDRSTLIVTEKNGSLARGAVINFVVKDNKLEYELSRTNAKKYELVIGSQLRELALKVE